MDPGQDDLTDPARSQSFRLPQDFLLIPAADTAARKGNDTVAAELVAAVLNLDKSPRVPGDFELHVFIDR